MFALVSITLFLSLVVAIFVLLLRSRAAGHYGVLPSAALVITQTPGNHSPRAYAHASAIIATKLADAVIYIAQSPFPPQCDGIHHLTIPTYDRPCGPRTSYALFVRMLQLSSTIATTIFNASKLPYTVTHILVNTPPAIPTLSLVAFLRPFLFPMARLIGDIHNPAYSLMSFTSPPIVVRAAAAVEAFSFHTADAHITVSRALSYFLRSRFLINATTVYDKPQRHFIDICRSSTTFSFHLLRKHGKILASANHPIYHSAPGETSSLQEKVPVLVSSSSWTPDEDFSVLLTALSKLDVHPRPLLVVLTGKGPGQKAFIDSVSALHLRHIAVAFVWLPLDLYPRLLAHSTLGVCLHASSSGVDLPMKAVDMLGAGLPVLALRFRAISELITPEVGFLFENGDELVDLVVRLTHSEPKLLPSLRANIRNIVDDDDDWLSHWRRHAFPVFDSEP